jgi:type I restriction enzyme S subunit
MHATSVSPVLVDPLRLDPDYYHPQHLEDEQRLRAFGAVSLKETGKFFAGPFGSKLPSSLYLDSGVPLFRVGNVGSMEVDLRDMAHLAPHVHADLTASEVRAGDLLIVKASVGEKICRVPATMERANITQHIIAIRPNGKYDFDYLAAFLFGNYGRRQLERRSLGSIIQYLGISDSKTVLFPKLGDNAQAYIGDKVRQAERLRAWARTVELEADQLLAAALGASPTDWLAGLRVSGLLPSGGFSTRVPAQLIRGRLDADGYHPELREISLRASGQPLFRQLPELVEIVTDQRERVKGGNSLLAYISILHVDTRGFIDFDAAASHTPESDGRECFPGDVLLSGINPAANRIGVCPDRQGRLACSPEFSILRPSGDVTADYLAFALRSIPCLHQLIHLGQGTSSSRRRIEEVELRDLWVPVITEHDAVAKQFALRQICIGFGGALTTAAKFLVEGLIDGKVSQADLQAAHTDREADRAILRRVTTKGLDVTDEPPLFPDLAQLERALADAGGPAT